MIKTIFLAGLLISPFIFYSDSITPYEIPKVWFIRVWIETLIIFGILFFKKSLSEKRNGKFLIKIIISFLGISMISSFVGMDLNKSWTGNYYRGDGLITLLNLIGLFLFLTYFLKKDWVEDLIKTIAISSIGLSILSVSIWILINIFSKYEIITWLDGGIGLTFGNPNFLVGYLLLSLPLTTYLINSEKFSKYKKTHILIWIVQIAAILLTKAWIGIFGIVMFLFLWVVINKNKFNIVLLSGFILIFAGLTAFYLFEKEPSAESRNRIYVKGLMAFTQRPIFGFGWSNFDYAFSSVDWPIHFEHDVYVDKAHSSLLEVLVTTGTIGFIFYAVIIGNVIKNLKKNKDLLSKCILISFLIVVIHSQTNVTSISEEVIFWIYAAASTLQHSRKSTS